MDEADTQGKKAKRGQTQRLLFKFNSFTVYEKSKIYTNSIRFTNYAVCT